MKYMSCPNCWNLNEVPEGLPRMLGGPIYRCGRCGYAPLVDLPPEGPQLKPKKDTVLLGLASGALIGGAAAGPAGALIGGLIGTMIASTSSKPRW